MTNSEHAFDLVIAGSGGGGILTALVAHHHGLKPLIIEKSKYFGGTTARSGGVLWVPQNRFMKEIGVSDSEKEARDYMDQMVKGRSSQAMQDAFVEWAPKLIDFLETHTSVRLQSMPGYPDYYPALPGGKDGGRCMEARVYNSKKLGREVEDMNPSIWELSKKFRMTGNEFHKIAMAQTSWAGKWTVMKVGLRMVLDLLPWRKHLSMGQALAAMLRKSLKVADIPLLLETPIVGLIEEDGRVVGVKAKKEGRVIEYRANKGVMLATGGFPHNAEMRKQYHPASSNAAWSLAHKGNTGDGIRLAEQNGAALDLMEDAWWGPMSINPNGVPFFHISERALPGTIMVNKAGKRFINEALAYTEMIHIIHDLHAKGDEVVPCYFIYDHTARKNYAFGLMRAGKPGKEYLDAGYVVQADSLEALAEKMGIQADNLKATVQAYNKMAETGKDTDFQKGDSVYDRRFGDPSVQPNPCMAPILKPPFYCSLLYPGDIGTKGGILTDELGRALREDHSVIDGLYACGNTTASVMGHSYPGAGATIAAAMTFGMIAARHMAGKS
ncbi:MAG: FAD-binding protein [Bacteroidota bacterium]